MGECTCFELPPEMWTTHYGAVEPGSTHEPNPDCPEHFRKPPYRLADGTWSDGVDRSVSIRRQPIRDRIKVSLSPWSGEWQVHNKLPRSTGVFNTWEKAIAYADRMARTNQGENNV